MDMYRWKALDFAALKRSSVSFFNVEKPETAVSRWARARTRAAKVNIQKTFSFFDEFLCVYGSLLLVLLNLKLELTFECLAGWKGIV